jgi:hypothetical protein
VPDGLKNGLPSGFICLLYTSHYLRHEWKYLNLHAPFPYRTSDILDPDAIPRLEVDKVVVCGRRDELEIARKIRGGWEMNYSCI